MSPVRTRPRLASDLAGPGIFAEVSSLRVGLGLLRRRVFYCVLETIPFARMCSIKTVRVRPLAMRRRLRLGLLPPGCCDFFLFFLFAAELFLS